MGSIQESDFIDNELPAGAWDSHVHVVDEDTFPLHPSHPYRPKKATLQDLLSFTSRIGTSHVCLIAFSVYHTDNRCLIDGLTQLQGRGRGVACIDPDNVTTSELEAMHAVGVRGIRLNLRTRGQRLDRTGFGKLLRRHADIVRPFGWVIQLYVAMDQIAMLAEVVPNLGVEVVIDHLGAPEPDRAPETQEGYVAFMKLLKEGKVWTKLSGTYRFSHMPGLEGYIKEILRIAPDRVVWASDWPHSGGVEKNPGGDRNAVQEYRKIDDAQFVRDCKKWCSGNQELIRKIWVDNPRKLWQYDRDD